MQAAFKVNFSSFQHFSCRQKRVIRRAVKRMCTYTLNATCLALMRYRHLISSQVSSPFECVICALQFTADFSIH